MACYYDFSSNVKGVTSIVGAVATDMGILTTPQLHWMVRARNKGMKASEQDYFEQLSSSFRCLVDLIPAEKCKFDGVNDKVVVDGSNGVRNSSEDGGVLNDGVGADYVQKEKVLPNNFGSKDTGIRCVSLDGDADRLVYFIVPPKSSGRIDLVDGDKILSLFALFIREQLSFLNEKEDMKNCHQAHVGVIQTAYANGASTNYLKLLGLEVNFTPTGVKYLHEKATEFDIGIYFEANGHGTVLFSESFIESLEARTNEISLGSKGSEGEKAALRLLALSKLINQAVGDALSGFLLVEVILQHMGWLINKWNELYHDLPSKQLKGSDRLEKRDPTLQLAPPSVVARASTRRFFFSRLPARAAHAPPCQRRKLPLPVLAASSSLPGSVSGFTSRFRQAIWSALECLPLLETVVVSPPGLQEAINEETAKNPQGRCFVRPSGTEDVVRVYAEASTQEAADTLANCVAKLVDQFLGFNSS
ncbi:Phosphoacetylglucosamine mutase [Glycine max]|nr:Phosphoacetylglucosamine mutase [Glycine max]